MGGPQQGDVSTQKIQAKSGATSLDGEIRRTLGENERRRLLNADSTSFSVPFMIEKGHLEAEGKGNVPQ